MTPREVAQAVANIWVDFPGATIQDVVGDGSCHFHALLDQLEFLRQRERLRGALATFERHDATAPGGDVGFDDFEDFEPPYLVDDGSEDAAEAPAPAA